MKQRIIAALVAIVVTSIAAQAQDNNGNRIVGDANLKVEGRKYYSYWGVGFSQEAIPQIAASSKDGVARDGVAKGSVSADLLGFYWPVGDPHMVIGIISNGALDANQLSAAEFDVTRFSTSGSVLYFPQGGVGDGLFLRGDLGLSGNRLQTLNGDSVTTKLGVGLLLGLGYAVPIANGTTLMLGGTVNVRRVGSENYGGLGLTAGTLF
jgi:hypothetical protein